MCEGDECGQCGIYADGLGMAEKRLDEAYDLLRNLIDEIESIQKHVLDSITTVGRVL